MMLKQRKQSFYHDEMHLLRRDYAPYVSLTEITDESMLDEGGHGPVLALGFGYDTSLC